MTIYFVVLIFLFHLLSHTNDAPITNQSTACDIKEMVFLKKPADLILSTIKSQFPSDPDFTKKMNEALQHATVYGHKELFDLTISYNFPTPKKTTLLHLAALGNQSSILEELIHKYEMNPLEANDHGNYPHHYAAKNNSIEAFKILHSFKGKHLLCNYRGETPLHWACKAGCLKMVTVMIEEFHYDPLETDDHGNNALLHSAMAKPTVSIDVFSYLMDRIKITSTSRDKENVLHFAAQAGNMAMVTKILEVRPQLKTERNIFAVLPALYAAREGHFDIYKILRHIKHRSNETDKEDKSALHYAALNGKAEFIKEFLKEKKKITLDNYQAKNGHTPLHEAILAQSCETINALLEKFKIDEIQMHEYLKFACEKSSREVVKNLIEKHRFVVLSAQDEHDNILNIALKNQKNDIAEYLCNNNNLKIDKSFLVHRSIYFDNQTFLEQLLQENMDLLENEYVNGLTPLLWAIACGNIAISEFLYKSGGMIKKLTQYNENGLHLAARENNTKMVQWLLSTKNFTFSDMTWCSDSGKTPLDLIDPQNKELIEYIAHCIWKSNHGKCPSCAYQLKEIPNTLYTHCGHLLCSMCNTISNSNGSCYACDLINNFSFDSYQNM
ncbi:MAG: ankyrin repeat domain-containing protein [Candidatus Dependentiae bacterium]